MSNQGNQDAQKGAQTLDNHDDYDVDTWIQHLTDEDMPVFAGTVTDVTHAVNSADTSAADVAQTILKDASLTSRLLKMANSFYYNPNGHQMTTITRAVMVLGFDQVRALALSLVLVDALSDGVHKNRMIDEMALSFHAAIQAQELAKLTKAKSPENVFVATLLSRLGNMAFWAFSGDKATDLAELIDAGEMSQQEAEKEVLGFHLKDLTRGLSKSWSLGELLDKSLSDDNPDDPMVSLVNMGQELAQAAKEGWGEDNAQAALESVASKLDMPLSNLKEITHKNAKQAKTITKMYGVSAASKRIPVPNIKLVDDDRAVAEVEEEANDQDQIENEATIDVENDSAVVEESIIHPEPDTNIQLTILQEITEAIEEKPSINVILEMVLEGIYRGVGMDRSLFAILSKDHKTLICKYAVGVDDELLSQQFKIDISHSSNVFQQVIKSKKAVHIPSDPKKIKGTLTRDTLKFLGTPPYLIMPTIVRGKVIGVFIADRNSSKRNIEPKDFLTFQQFCQQANMGLTFLTMQG